MAEIRDEALLLRRIPYGDTSLILHFLTREHGRISLMARGARQARSAWKAALAPLYVLRLVWKTGRTGMGTLTDIERGELLLPEARHLTALELLAIAGRLFREDAQHGYVELREAMQLLCERPDAEGLQVAVWSLLDKEGLAGDLGCCWECGRELFDAEHVFWSSATMLCQQCGQGMPVSAGLRRGMRNSMINSNVVLSAKDLMDWRKMTEDMLRSQGLQKN